MAEVSWLLAALDDVDAIELFRDDLRERIVYSYRIFYHVQSETVTILAVLHGARQVTDILLSRLPPEQPNQ